MSDKNEKSKPGKILEALDNMTPEDWKKVAEETEAEEKARGAWLKPMIKEGEDRNTQDVKYPSLS